MDLDYDLDGWSGTASMLKSGFRDKMKPVKICYMLKNVVVAKDVNCVRTLRVINRPLVPERAIFSSPDIFKRQPC